MPTETTDRRIYVVVPVHNRRILTERFLDCMRQQSFRDFDIIVVDDGSTDGTADLITTRFPEATLLYGDGTLWWTGAINVGIRHAMARAGADDGVLVINDDLEVDPDYLARFYEQWISLPDTLIGSVCVDIDNPDNIADGGMSVNWWTAKIRRLNTGRKLSEVGHNFHAPVSVLTGRGVLIPSEVFRRIGLYNDRHYQQSGDDELPVRARAAGYRLVISYACVVKMHTRASDAMNVSERYALKDLRRYFFDIRSNTRLRIRFFFAYDTARNPLAFVSFLLCDLARITVHFAKRVRLQPIRQTAL